MRMTAINAQTERKRQDKSVRCVEKYRDRAKTMWPRGPIRPVSTACATAGAGRGEKRFSSARTQVILASDRRHLGGWRLCMTISRFAIRLISVIVSPLVVFCLIGRIMNQWYLIQFKPNSHGLAERNLHRQGFETFLPMQKITRRKISRFTNDLKPLFPGYMFVSSNPSPAHWRMINSTIGVSKLISLEGQPKPLPTQLISGLMLRCDASGILLPPDSLSEGDSVEMLTGPFTNFIATVDTIGPEQRIWVLLEFMGQKTRMQVSASQLQLTKQVRC